MKKITKRMIAGLIVALMIIIAMPFSAIANETDGNEVSIAKSGYETIYKTLAEFRDSVNNGTTYNGYTVTLLKDIDLKNELWVPIGNTSNTGKIFEGDFDGDNHTISNLNVSTTGAFAGLFGYTGWARTISIKNLNINNAVVCTTSETGAAHAGVVVGQNQQYITMDNIHITGIVQVEVKSKSENTRDAAGIIGKTVGGAKITNCSVIADQNSNSYIKSYNSGASAGGIMGFMAADCSADVYFENCDVENLDVSAFHRVGGVVGTIQKNDNKNNKKYVTNCSVKNVNVTATGGGAATASMDGRHSAQAGLIVGCSAGSKNRNLNIYSNNTYAGDCSVTCIPEATDVIKTQLYGLWTLGFTRAKDIGQTWGNEGGDCIVTYATAEETGEVLFNGIYYKTFLSAYHADGAGKTGSSKEKPFKLMTDVGYSLVIGDKIYVEGDGHIFYPRTDEEGYRVKTTVINDTVKLYELEADPAESVAKIEETDTYYITLDEALTAATGGTLEKPIVVELLVEEASFSKAPSSYTTIIGLTDETGAPKSRITSVPATAGPIYSSAVDYGNTNSVGITFKNLLFHEIGKVTIAGDYTTFDNCVFSRDSQSGTTESNQLVRIYGKNIELKGCTFKGEYNATYNSYVFEDGVLTIDNCKFENLGKRSLQFMSDTGNSAKGCIYVKNSSIAGKITIGRSYTNVVFDNCNFLACNKNEIGLYPSKNILNNCTFATEYINGVDATETASHIDAFGCEVTDSSDIYKIFKPTQGIASIDATYDKFGKQASGRIVSLDVPSELANECKAAQIGDNLYIVGKDAKASEYKLTGGKFVENPIMYVADGYGVKASGDQDYPFEVYEITEEQPEQTEIVIEQPVITEVGEKVDPEEKKVAKEVLEKTEVKGVAEALTEKGQSEIVKAAVEDKSELTQEDVDKALQTQIDIAVEAVAVEVKVVTTKKATDKEITFELTPYAVVTAIAPDGSMVSSEKVLVENDYLSKNAKKPITVVLGTTFEPEQVLHIRDNGEIEAFKPGTQASYENKTYKYDSIAKTVTLKILDFSEVKILATALAEYEVSFDANGGTGTMATQKIVYGSAFYLPECEFTAPENKKFSAWQIGLTKYNPGDKIEITKAIKIKAVWEDAAPKTGDSNNIGLFVGLGGVALLAIIALAVLMLKKKTYR